MSSLVAYEDSESEDENFEQKVDRTALQSESHKEKQEVPVWYSSEAGLNPPNFTLQPDRSAQDHHECVSEGNISSICHHSQPWVTPYCSDSTSTNLRDSAAAWNVGETEGRVSAPQRRSHTTQSSDDRFKTSKRLCSDQSSGIRPYIPKRQRLGTLAAMEDSKFPEECLQRNQTTESQILLSVSERVRTYIDHKRGLAGIPRKLFMSLGGHQGPVNTLQWCPVPHLSHLLLSASMDKTLKVCLIQSIDNCLATCDYILPPPPITSFLVLTENNASLFKNHPQTTLFRIICVTDC